jgi:hypothetical protein
MENVIVRRGKALEMKIIEKLRRISLNKGGQVRSM